MRDWSWVECWGRLLTSLLVSSIFDPHLPSATAAAGRSPSPCCRTAERSTPNCLRRRLAECRPCGTLRHRLHAGESAELSNNVCRAVAARFSGGGRRLRNRARLEFDEVASPRAAAAGRSAGFGNWSEAASQALFVSGRVFTRNVSVEKLE